ncbi:MAG: hypothetical protein IJ455_01450 [Agathobacter sp.]|nr:hypothetical protein [Agathobacter sp.]
MDVKKMIEKLIDEIQKDGKLGTQFKNDPVKVIENIIGKDLPDETVEKIIDGVNAKVNLDKAMDAIDKIDDMLDNVDMDKVDDVLKKVDLDKAGDVLDKVGDVADALKKFF